MNRLEAKKLHGEIGILLTLIAWRNSLECLVIDRREMSLLCGVSQFRDARLNWFREDIETWFPHIKRLIHNKNTFSSIWLSCKPFPSDNVFSDPMADEERINRHAKLLPVSGIISITNLKPIPQVIRIESVLKTLLGNPSQLEDFDRKFTISTRSPAASPISNKSPVINNDSNFLQKPIDAIGLTVRTSNCLKAENIFYVSELVRKTERALLRSQNMGRKSLNEIKTVLNSNGLSLALRQ